MKKLSLLIALLITLGSFAQWTSDTDVNTLVVEPGGNDMQAVQTADGQTYVVFWKSVGAPNNYELWLQLLDASGNKQFGDEGMMISNTIPMSTFTVAWSVSVDANDDLYVGVTGTGDYSGRVFKMDTEGTHLWGTDGLVITGTAFNVTLLPMQSGNIAVSYIAGDQAVIQKFDSDANPIWANPTTITSGTSKTAPGNMFETSDESISMMFHTYAYGVNSTMYAQKYDNDGNAVWTNPSQLSDKTTAYNTTYSGVQDGDVFYIGYMGVHDNRFDSYVQCVNPDGTLPWGLNGMDFDINETNFEMNTQIAFEEGSPYVWAICIYTDNNQNQAGEFVQKFDKETGARQFTDNAKMIYGLNAIPKVHASALHITEGHPFFLLKTGMDNGASPTRLDVLKLDTDGNFAWPEEVKPMATYEANKGRIYLSGAINNQCVALFNEDKSNGEKIYAQNFVFGEVSTPEQPVLVSPENETEDVALAATFTWEASIGAASYTLQIAEDASFTNMVTEETGISNTEYDYTLANFETTYYWRVKASNTSGDSDWSTTWNFTTLMAAPEQPVLLTPENEATALPKELTFTWESTQNADTYTLQISEDEAFTSLLVDESGLTATSYDFILPDYLTTYFWRVMATNTTGDSDWSAVWSFTTDLNIGMENIAADLDLNIYPNPATEYMMIDLNQNATISIYSLAGTLVKSIDIDGNNSKVDISDLADGAYLLKLYSTEGAYLSSQKMIKK